MLSLGSNPPKIRPSLLQNQNEMQKQIQSAAAKAMQAGQEIRNRLAKRWGQRQEAL